MAWQISAPRSDVMTYARAGFQGLGMFGSSILELLLTCFFVCVFWVCVVCSISSKAVLGSVVSQEKTARGILPCKARPSAHKHS